MQNIQYVLNGRGFGNVAETLMGHDFDVNAMSPYISDRDGLPYVRKIVTNSLGYPEFKRDKNTGRILRTAEGMPIPKTRNVCVANSGVIASLRRDDWIAIDEAVLRVAKPQLKLIGNLRSKGLQYVIPNGFGKTVFQYERMTDVTEANIAMDPNVEGVSDRVGFDIVNLPLPMVFKDFWLSTRTIMASRNGGTPIDTATAEAAAERVAELMEKLAIGVAATTSFGGGTVYGMVNFPDRMLKTLTHPDANGWTPQTFVDEVIAMRAQSRAANHNGPWTLYVAPFWESYLDGDYAAAGAGTTASITLRERVKKIEGIQEVLTLDYMTGKRAVLCENSNKTIREIIGMDITTFQWNPTPFRTHFKIAGIMVPQLRTDTAGQTGIVDGVAPDSP